MSLSDTNHNKPIFAAIDEDGDEVRIQPPITGDGDAALYLSATDDGVFLSTTQIAELRDVLSTFLESQGA